MKFAKYCALIAALVLCAALLCACGGKEADCAGNHTAGNWQTVTEATCGAEGKETAVCTVCGADMERTVAATGKHTFGEWEVLKNATFTEEGEKTRHCTVCNAADAVTAIRALGAGPEVLTSAGTVDLALPDFEILYDDATAGALLAARAKDLADAIYASMGLQIPVQQQSHSNDGGGLYEILIGNTNRPESNEVYKSIQGDGFAVNVVGQKLVIIGTDNMQTLNALQYFIDTYFTATSESTTLRVNKTATANYATVVTVLSQANGTAFDFVFDKNADNDPKHAYVKSSTSDSRDYPPKASESLAGKFETLAGLTAGGVVWRDDSKTTQYEILIGVADRPEAKSLLAAIDGNEYAILVTEDKVLLMAHCDYALSVCVARFQELLTAAATKDENGKTVWNFPLGFRVVGEANEKVISDFTRPAGLSLYSSLYLDDNAMQYVYMDKSISVDTYNAYRAVLIGEGYRVLQENEIQGSHFITLVHDTKKIMLYVAYNAFSSADEPHNRDNSTHQTEYAYLDYVPILRVVSAPLDSAYVPDESLFVKQGYSKITQSSITTVRVQDAIGHCYIFLLEDGTFVVIDGGSNTTEARTQVWNSLVGLYKGIWGVEPSSASPVHVRAWYLTHSHGDHYANFYNLLKERQAYGDLKLDYLLGNFPEIYSIYSVGGDTVWAGNNIENIELYGRCKYIKVYAGQVLYFANLKMEVLMTYADHAPRRIDNSNDSNTVTRLTFDNKDATSKQTMIVLGDSCVYTSRWLCAMYGDYLQADMVQLAHHGNIGCEIALYKIIQPTVVWYPHSSSGYNSWSGQPNSNAWPYNVTNYVVRKLESVQYIYVGGVASRSGCEALTLKFKADGTPDYANIYNPIKGSKYSYNTTSLCVTSTPALKIR